MYRLLFQSREAARPPFTGDAGTVVIGREPGCALQLTDAGIRDRHAAIERRADGYYVRDLSGTRSVRVNDEAAGERRLSSGDQLEIGALRVQFQVVQEVPDGRRALDVWQALAVVTVTALVVGQIVFFGWIFTQPHPRNMKTDVVKGKAAKQAQKQAAKPVNPTPQHLLPLVPVTPAPTPAPEAAAAPAPLNRRLRIAKIERLDGAAEVTFRIQIKAQVGEQLLDPATVSIAVHCFTGATQPPVTQVLPGPANWENFTTKQLSARFAIPPAQCAGYVVRTYYRQQLQDVVAVPAALATLAP